MPLAVLLVTISALCWWLAFRGHLPESRTAIHDTWRGGWLVGGAGFAAGFIGPLVIWPGASLGPLLGILFTGPVGFVLGALGAILLRRLRTSG